MFVSDKDIVIAGPNGLSARFVAGVARPLRESLVDIAKANGVKAVEEKKPTRKAAPKATEAE